MQRLRALLDDLDLRGHLAGTGPSVVIALCWLVDDRLIPKLDRLRAYGYGSVMVSLALAAMAALAPARAALATRLLALATAAVVLAPMLRARYLKLPKLWALKEPELIVYPAGVAFLLAIATAIAGGFDARAHGIGRGDWRWWVPRTALAVTIMVGFGAASTIALPSLREYYPHDIEARRDFGSLLFIQATRGLFLLCEEFFWHGLALFAITRTHGPRAAVLVTSFLYFAMHGEKPELEMASSFLGGLLLGIACLRAGTFWPAFLVHWPLNLAVEITAYALEGPRLR